MGKKNKLGISTLVERVEQLVNDALKRIDTLQKQVNDLREQVMERVGFTDKPAEKSKRPSTAGKSSGTTQKASQTAKKSGNSGSTAKSTTQKASSASKSKASGAEKDDLTRINGIGPATAKKMQAKGITTIKQLANPSADDQEKLEEFRKLKNFPSWQAEAKKLV